MAKKKEEETEPKVGEEVVKKEDEFDLGKLLNDPAVVGLLGCGEKLFKKEKSDPNVCEINIKAPSEVVLKLFNVK